MREQKLLTIVITRRYVAAAYFVGTRLEHVAVRRVEAGTVRGQASVRRFVSWLVGSLSVECVAIAPHNNRGEGLMALWNAAKEILTAASIPIEIIDPAKMLRECAETPFPTVAKFRKAIASFWPVLTGDSSTTLGLHAAGLGIYVQTRRYVDFIINSLDS
jgi:hypothetical protein